MLKLSARYWYKVPENTKWSSDLLWLSNHCCGGVRASLGSVLGNSLHAAFRWAFRCFQRRFGQYYGTHCDITAIVGCCCLFFFQLSSQPLALGTGRGDLTGRHSSTTSAHPKCRNPHTHFPPEPYACFTEEDDGSPLRYVVCPPSTGHFVPSPPWHPARSPAHGVMLEPGEAVWAEAPPAFASLSPLFSASSLEHWAPTAFLFKCICLAVFSFSPKTCSSCLGDLSIWPSGCVF